MKNSVNIILGITGTTGLEELLMAKPMFVTEK